MIEIIPKPTKKMLPWENIALVSAVLVLTTAILAYAVLIYFNNKSENIIQGIEEEIVKVGAPQDKFAEANVFSRSADIKFFSSIFNESSKTSKIFDFLETVTHPEVWFSKLDFNLKENKASLSGSTENFQTLGQQLAILRNQKFIQTIDLSNIDLNKEGQVEFDFKILFNKDIFK